MKKILTITALILIAALALSACSAGTSRDTVSMYDLREAMSEGAGFGDMTYVSSSDTDAEEKFDYLSDFDYSKVDSFFMYFASDGSKNADELAVIAVKDERYAAEAKASLEKHLEYRKSLYRTYCPEELPKLEGAKVAVNGIYAALIVADRADSVKASFERFIAGGNG